MVFMRCSQCGKDITSKPCPYCGNKHVNIEVQVSDGITVSDEIKGIVIKGSSEATIEKGGKVHKYPFGPGVRSDQILFIFITAKRALTSDRCYNTLYQ
jgi:hypothetical protein